MGPPMANHWLDGKTINFMSLSLSTDALFEITEFLNFFCSFSVTDEVLL